MTAPSVQDPIRRLLDVLEAAGVWPYDYTIEGVTHHGGNEAPELRQRAGRWELVYWERGQADLRGEFDELAEACEAMLTMLTPKPARLGPPMTEEERRRARAIVERDQRDHEARLGRAALPDDPR